jgi:hypothetical protein
MRTRAPRRLAWLCTLLATLPLSAAANGYYFTVKPVRSPAPADATCRPPTCFESYARATDDFVDVGGTLGLTDTAGVPFLWWRGNFLHTGTSGRGTALSLQGTLGGHEGTSGFAFDSLSNLTTFITGPAGAPARILAVCPGGGCSAGYWLDADGMRRAGWVRPGSTVMEDLSHAGPSAPSMVHSIRDDGLVVGSFRGNTGMTRGFSLDADAPGGPAGFINYGTITPQGTVSMATDVNPAGLVVGCSSYAETGLLPAHLTGPGSGIDLGLPSWADSGCALAVTESGWSVGFAAGQGKSRPMLWDPWGRASELEFMVAPSTELPELVEATDAMHWGQIVGWGFSNQRPPDPAADPRWVAFLLEPTVRLRQVQLDGRNFPLTMTRGTTVTGKVLLSGPVPAGSAPFAPYFRSSNLGVAEFRIPAGRPTTIAAGLSTLDIEIRAINPGQADIYVLMAGYHLKYTVTVQ